MLQISEKIGHEKHRFWNNYQHFMKRGYTQLFIKKAPSRRPFVALHGRHVHFRHASGVHVFARFKELLQ